MFRKLIYLNWSAFLARLTNFQAFLVIGYIIFLLILFSNLLGSALVIVLFDHNPAVISQLPWLTSEIHQLITLIFANVLWILHFSFTSTRLLNMPENRKLLAFGYPVKKLSWHLNLMGFLHPLNLIYNFTWLVFLLIQIKHLMYVPVVLAVVLLNYAIIYSIKHRFLKVIEKRFKLIVFSALFVIFGTIQAIAIISREFEYVVAQYLPGITTLNSYLFYTPGGLLQYTATGEYSLGVASAIYGFTALLIFLIFRDHFLKTREGLLQPIQERKIYKKNQLWHFLKKWLGLHAGKFYYYVLSHSYNRLQLLTIALIPAVYIPLLLQLNNNYYSALLIPTMLAAIPVALLAMGMANMYGYENKEFLLHRQFPSSFERQLKERFLGIIVVPLLIFYLITTAEILYLPQLGSVVGIYIANTFFFACFMLVFIWSSFYYYKKADYTSFSFKHPIISQKVTFMMVFLIFGLGYAVFAPIGNLQIYRLYVMGGLILAISVYLWRNMNVLVRAFDKHILHQVWDDAGQ
ncbi:hypothetical protein [Fodinibius halophilus]|uniref:Uncharacterized protein n=1 Tax=Fodinibius halophilus TaxID=1736908 RepID=A0A6M1T3K0_9BACT|nr:hypothetical protein [Fodinibius halophilus]NGP87213.1 hypothetical protein [Fodinibius halophilus]